LIDAAVKATGVPINNGHALEKLAGVVEAAHAQSERKRNASVQAFLRGSRIGL
jgi:hypothetical protein